MWQFYCCRTNALMSAIKLNNSRTMWKFYCSRTMPLCDKWFKRNKMMIKCNLKEMSHWWPGESAVTHWLCHHKNSVYKWACHFNIFFQEKRRNNSSFRQMLPVLLELTKIEQHKFVVAYWLWNQDMKYFKHSHIISHLKGYFSWFQIFLD